MYRYKFLFWWWIWGLLCVTGGALIGLFLVRQDVSRNFEAYAPELQYLRQAKKMNQVVRFVVHLKSATMDVEMQNGGYTIPVSTGAEEMDERTGKEMGDYSGSSYKILRKEFVSYGFRYADGEFIAAPYTMVFDDYPQENFSRSIHEGELVPSHGCVVVPYGKGQMLFALTPIGTPVEFRKD